MNTILTETKNKKRTDKKTSARAEMTMAIYSSWNTKYHQGVMKTTRCGKKQKRIYLAWPR
jgi:hypothetical protein